jgi:outer membrane protein TolC
MKTPLLLLIAAPLWSQEPLSLRDAVKQALAGNQAIVAATAGQQAADSKLAQARSGMLPKVNYAETFTRGNNPVYVFGSLLTQNQFTERNFAIGSLNQPDFLNNFQSTVTVDQMLYDAGQTKLAARSAQLAQKLTGEEGRRVRMDVIAGVARAYYGAILAGEALKTAEQAVKSAEADLQRAQAVRDAGMATDVDVLSIRVHLAQVNEHRIRRAADLDVARAALNDALGLPLDAAHRLTTPLAPAAVAAAELAGVEKEAAEARPEARQTRLAVNLAKTQSDAARAAFLPVVSVRGAFEADRQRFVTRAGNNWMAAVSLRWNLFNGNADKARVAEAGHMVRKAEADEVRTTSALKLQVRRAWADLSAAGQRIDAARAAVAESEESLRITQNRYAAGMSNVTDLLRTETAVLETRTRYLAAVHDQRVAATMLEYAAGRLSADSEVLN